MRDPARIDLVLGLVGIVWKENPDLRLTQLIMNLMNGQQGRDDMWLFYLDDEELIAALLSTYGDDNAE